MLLVRSVETKRRNGALLGPHRLAYPTHLCTRTCPNYSKNPEDAGYAAYLGLLSLVDRHR